jgi:mannose-1-phosphate guanylyltransferase
MDTSRSVHGIILAGTYHWGESALEELVPRPLLPVAQTPLVCYSLRWLREGGVRRATLCTNSASRAVRSLLGDGASVAMDLDYYEDWTPRGAAGCARDAAAPSEAETFVIADGTAIPAVEIQALLEAHRSSRAAVTVVVHRDGIPSADGEASLSPAGIYVFERRAFEYVAPTSFQDIKENLIPRLYRDGERVVTYAGAGSCPRVLNAETYLSVSQWMVERIVGEPASLTEYVPRGSALIHRSAYVEEGARLVGPVIVGPSARVKSGATVIGPTTVGLGSTIERGAVVSRSVAWARCAIEPDAVVDRCVLTDDVVVGPQERLFNAVKLARHARAAAEPRRSVPLESQAPAVPAGALLAPVLSPRVGSA